MTARRIPAVLVILSLALLITCGEDNVTDTGPEYSRATPQDLIKALAYAMEVMEIDVYDECLHDNYLFTFLAADAEYVGLPEDEPWWGKTQDITATARLFSDSTVALIECDLNVSGGPWPSEDGFVFRLEPTLRVTIIEKSQPEPTIWLVNASWLEVEVVADEYDTTKWVFSSVAETLKEGSTSLDPGFLAEPVFTWGLVKAVFAPEGKAN